MYTLIGPKEIISNMQKRTMNYKSVFFEESIFMDSLGSIPSLLSFSCKGFIFRSVWYV